MSVLPTSDALSAGGKQAVAAALGAIETRADDPALVALLDWAYTRDAGHVAGITGPPGVGKSTLIGALVSHWRRQGLSVGVIAIDPSSRRSGGALLGDRTRIITDPDDPHAFVRSMAARDRLGGLADMTYPAAILMRAVYDRVIVETVGVGQSETDIADVADTVIFCVQPGSGDALQFMKAGIMEVPHLAVVTKADMGPAADRARADVESALRLAAPESHWAVRVLSVSVQTAQGVDGLADAIEDHGRWLDMHGERSRCRQRQAESFIRYTVRDRFGSEGLSRAQNLPGPALALPHGASPFAVVRQISSLLKGA